MTYRCEFFDIRELVPKHVHQERGEKAWALLDPYALQTLDQLRQQFGPLMVNNWHREGQRNWSGLRTQGSPYGSEYSQHRFGRAFDCISMGGLTADTMRNYILKNPDKFPYLNALEMGVSWLHFDTRNCERIFTFNP